MSATLESRLATVEAELAELSGRVRLLEPKESRPQAPQRAVPRQRVEWARSGSVEPVSARPRQVQRRRQLDLEELLGGRLLALVGGAAVLIGLAFFVALAVQRAWIGEGARVAVAFAGSALLAGAGIWLGERRRRDQASLALVGTGIGGGFLSLVAARALYHLAPVPLALAAALALGAVATALAVRWHSQTLAGLGIVGALAAPLLAGGHADLTSTGFVLVALTASAGVLLWRRWEWLRIVAFALGVSQVGLWIFAAEPRDATTVVVLSLVALVQLAGALGFEARAADAQLRPSTALLVALDAVTTAGLGAFALGDAAAAGGWIAALALAHALLGIAALRSHRIADELGRLLLAVSVVAGDTAFALLTSGPTLACGWAASAVALAWLARRADAERTLLQIALTGQLALATVHALLFDAPLRAVAEGGAARPAAAVTVAVVVGAFACARLTRSETPATKRALDAFALAGLLYMIAAVLDGTPLVLAWAAGAAALAELGRRLDDDTARHGSLAFLTAAAVHLLVFEAPPDALLHGVGDLGSAALAAGALTLGAFRTRRAWPHGDTRTRLGLAGGGAAVALYLCSVAIVDVFQLGAGGGDLGLDAGSLQQGQAALSALWALTGLTALAAGVRIGRRELRLGGLGLLTLATAKVFLYDLSALDSTWRVLSFVVLGLLLLAAALIHQRSRRPAGSPGPHVTLRPSAASR